MFREGGYEGAVDDPAALSVRARLTKDLAIAASGAEQRILFREAGRLYMRAAEISGATYPLINAATLSLLAGDRAESQMRAAMVLDRDLADAGGEETPYFQLATRSEAFLLLGDIPGARKELAAAMAGSPHAYEDHASTLRQFALILGAVGADAAWLDALRPPRSLHFAGHLHLAPDIESLKADIRTIMREQNIGFGFGALAAGADILFGEALLEAGAELHLVLPAPVALFRDASVARCGGDWADRFDSLIERADSLRCLDGTAGPSSSVALQLAAELAMGRAVMQADALLTEAVQILVIDPDADGSQAGSSSWVGALWAGSGRRQWLVDARRDSPAADSSRHKSQPQALGLVAGLPVELPDAQLAGPADSTLARLSEVLATGPEPLVPPRWTGTSILVAYDRPQDVVAAARLAALALPGRVRIAGAYGIAKRQVDPFDSSPILVGPYIGELDRIAHCRAPGIFLVGADFAAALCARSAPGTYLAEYTGELASTPEGASGGLYAIRL
jgi:hypothetical protein